MKNSRYPLRVGVGVGGAGGGSERGMPTDLPPSPFSTNHDSNNQNKNQAAGDNKSGTSPSESPSCKKFLQLAACRQEFRQNFNSCSIVHNPNKQWCLANLMWGR